MIKENIKNCSFFIRKEFAKAREDFMDYEDDLREEEKNDPINNRMVAVYTRKRNFAEWQMRYSFPEIILLVGDSQLTKAVLEHIKESEGFVKLLTENDITVIQVEDTMEPKTPDSVFPNNWFSTHEGGILVLYPMRANNRRAERKK